MNRQEAINIVKKNWPDSSFTSLKEALEFLIPELMNTDDEKIKEAIIKGIIHAAEEGCFCADNYSVKECVAWIEKQGEQKLIDKIRLGKMYKCIASPKYSTFMKGLIYVPQDKFLCSLMNFCSDCFEPIEDGEQKFVEWSEEDRKTIETAIK